MRAVLPQERFDRGCRWLFRDKEGGDTPLFFVQKVGKYSYLRRRLHDNSKGDDGVPISCLNPLPLDQKYALLRAHQLHVRMPYHQKLLQIHPVFLKLLEHNNIVPSEPRLRLLKQLGASVAESKSTIPEHQVKRKGVAANAAAKRASAKATPAKRGKKRSLNSNSPATSTSASQSKKRSRS